MESLVHQPAHDALLHLERSSAFPAELLGEAARIVDTDFDEIRGRLFKEVREEKPGPSVIFSPKEEWALRWLLKKTKAASTAAVDPVEGQPANNDPRKWLLLYHLVPRIQTKRLAKLLREHDAMQHIKDALAHQLEVIAGFEARSEKQWSVWGDVECEYDMPKGESKRRKRSPGSDEPQFTRNPSLQILLCILQVLKVCLKKATNADEGDIFSQQHMRMALSMAPERTAQILGQLFRVADKVLCYSSQPPVHDLLLDLLHTSTQLWDLRQCLDMGQLVEESDKSFTAACLLPCLSVLRSIKDHSCGGKYKNFEAQIEKLVALHTVQPSRKVFFEELAAEWTPDQDPLLSEHLKPTVSRLQHFFASQQWELSVKHDSPAFGCVTSLLLGIAIRSSERNNVRRIQQEQPWLEALFACLAHMGGYTMIDDEPHGVPSDEKGSHQPFCGPDASFRGADCLKSMLVTLVHSKLSLSLPLLSSLMQSIAGLQKWDARCFALVDLFMQIDVNVFIPNSGLSAATNNLKLLIDKIDAEAEISPNISVSPSITQHVLLKTLSSLMQGFASARDLATFVDVWSERLAALEDTRRINHDSVESSSEMHNLWDDEDTVAAFAQVAQLYATPIFIESHLTRTIEALRDQSYTGKHYALVVVCDSLVTTYKEEIGSVSGLAEAIFKGIQVPTHENVYFGKLPGWLWRLSRHLLPLLEIAHMPSQFQDLHARGSRSIVDVPLKSAVANTDYFWSMQALLDVEFFHCFIAVIAMRPDSGRGNLEPAISALGEYLAQQNNDILEQEITQAKIWDGRAASLKSSADLLMAFLGILLQNTAVLCANVDATVDLLAAMVPFLTLGDKGERKTGFTNLYQAILLDPALISTPGFVKKCVKATNIIDEARINDINLVQLLPQEAFSKPQRRHLAEWREKMATSHEHANTIPEDFHSCQQHLPYRLLLDLCQNAEAVDMHTLEDLGAESEMQDFLTIGIRLQKGDLGSPDITRLATRLANLLPQAKSVHHFCLNADCLSLILDKHHDQINQWTIDNLLAQICLTLSPQGPAIPAGASVVFVRLCSLIGHLLGSYRVRLGGRYHLVLPVLNGLLHCLFAPEIHSLKNRSQIAFHSILPAWIIGDAVKLGKDASTHLSRLLSSICDPTPSAVRKSHNDLTDETKKARRIAGEHMQYFIAEYTQCQLHGIISLEAKEGLIPGLYAVLDAMDKEVMRGMNAGMNASQRAIWKVLYADWMRFGKWNGE